MRKRTTEHFLDHLSNKSGAERDKIDFVILIIAGSWANELSAGTGDNRDWQSQGPTSIFYGACRKKYVS